MTHVLDGTKVLVQNKIMWCKVGGLFVPFLTDFQMNLFANFAKIGLPET